MNMQKNFIRAGAARIRALIPGDILLHHVSLLSFSALLKGGEEHVAEAILADLNAPLDCGGIPIATRVGVGLAFCKGLYGADVLRTALVAAQDSRKNGVGYAYYDSQPDNAHRPRLFAGLAIDRGDARFRPVEPGVPAEIHDAEPARDRRRGADPLDPPATRQR